MPSWSGYLRRLVEVTGVVAADTRPPEEHHVVVGGTRLHYLEWGALDKPLLLFLHGGGMTARTWDAICLALRGDYRCLALDQRGHGDSEWSPEVDYRLEAYERDIAGLLDILEIESPNIVGMSMGGANALFYAGRHAHVRTMVLVDTSPRVPKEEAARITRFMQTGIVRDAPEEFIAPVLEYRPNRDAELTRMTIRQSLRELPDGRWTWKWDPRLHLDPGFLDSVVAREGVLWEAATGVKCPTLIARGERSRVLGAEDAELLRRSIAGPADLVTIAGAGHNVQSDNPLALIAALQAFLDRRAHG
jgi:esterase